MTAGGAGIGGIGGPGGPDRPGGDGGGPWIGGGSGRPLSGDGGPPIALVFGMLSATIGGLGLLFAMVILGRRRRPEDEGPQLVPATAGAAMATAGAAVVAAPTWPMAGDVLPTEAGVPRWRRQSLRETRMRSERDAPAPRIALVFRTPPEPGVERRRVAYSLVRLSSEPDEILGQDLGWLDKGDEVEVLETRGVHWLVRTPDGGVGWIHRTTLETEAIGSEEDADDGAEAEDDATTGAAAGPADAGASPLDDFFRFSTGGLGARDGEPRIH